jgi:hypothetical protein
VLPTTIQPLIEKYEGGGGGGGASSRAFGGRFTANIYFKPLGRSVICYSACLNWVVHQQQ